MTEDDKASFVPRPWAGKKVDYLLSEIRQTEQPEKELVDEVTYLAKRYGIVTPYTAYLMTDDVAGKDQSELSVRFSRGLQAGFGGGIANPTSSATPAPGGDFRAGGRPVPANEPAEREAQVRAAKALGESRRATSESGAADALYDFATSGLSRDEKKNGKTAMNAIRYIGSRTFYQSEGVWYDSDFNSEKDKAEKTLKVGSAEYLELIKSDKRIVKYLALGDVIIKVQGKWYRFES
jgi:Ca-activated chloride channel family protein